MIKFKTALALLFLLTAFPAAYGQETASKKTAGLMGNRFLTFNAVIRVNQIEVSRNRNVGEDERALHTPERVTAFRKAVEDGFPGAKMTWALSWLALQDTTTNYKEIRKLTASVK
jgi:hypothetical protein